MILLERPSLLGQELRERSNSPTGIRIEDNAVLAFVLERLVIPTGIQTEAGHAAFEALALQIREKACANARFSFIYNPDRLNGSALTHRQKPVICELEDLLPGTDQVYALYISDKGIEEEIRTLLNE